MNHDGHAPHTFLMWESHHQEEWEREDSLYRYQAIRQDEAPCYFQIYKGNKIPAGDAGSAGNLQVPEDYRLIIPKMPFL